MKTLPAKLATATFAIGLLISTLMVAQGKPLTNADIIALVKGGLSETAVVELIQRSATGFSLEPADLVALRESGIPDAIITAMIRTRTTQAPSATSSPRRADVVPSTRSAVTLRRLHPIKQDGKWGFIDSTGTVRIRPTLDSHWWGNEEPYLVRKGKKWTYIDETGAKAIDREFDNDEDSPRAYPFSDGLAIFCESKGNFMVGRIECGFMDGAGNTVIPAGQLKAIIPPGFSEGFARAEGGYVDRSGRLAIPGIPGQPFRDGLAGALARGGWGFVNTAGTFVIPPQFDAVQPFSDGMAAVQRRGKWGYIDTRGQTLIEPRYDVDLKGGAAVFMFGSSGVTTARPFSQGLAAVHLGKRRWAYIDKTGMVRIEVPFPSWTPPGAFVGGLASVWDGDKLGYIDVTGRTVWKPAD